MMPSQGDTEMLASEIISLHGDSAVDHVLDLIEGAVRNGDDTAVKQLDHLLRLVEAHQAGSEG
jgi:hypothetical protein